MLVALGPEGRAYVMIHCVSKGEKCVYILKLFSNLRCLKLQVDFAEKQILILNFFMNELRYLYLLALAYG